MNFNFSCQTENEILVSDLLIFRIEHTEPDSFIFFGCYVHYNHEIAILWHASGEVEGV